MKHIGLEEINSLKFAKQNFRDCYLVSSISALTNSQNGRRILQQNILTNGKDFCVRFNDVCGKPETYFVKQEECDMLILTNRFLEPVPLEAPDHPIIKAVEVAMNKLLSIHPSKKPFVCRIPDSDEKFEFNKVSNFLKMFTGIRPFTLNESGIRMNLKKVQNTATTLFDRLGYEDEFSFVIGSGYKGPLSDLPHCWTLRKVFPKSKNVVAFDSRKQANSITNYDVALKKYKFICGYFNEMLE